MNFGNLGFMEILLVLVVALLLFGAKRLPEIGASMGKGIREFKRSVTDVERNLHEPPARDARLEHDYASDRLPTPADTREHREEDRPEPKRLLG